MCYKQRTIEQNYNYTIVVRVATVFFGITLGSKYTKKTVMKILKVNSAVWYRL